MVKKHSSSDTANFVVGKSCEQRDTVTHYEHEDENTTSHVPESLSLESIVSYWDRSACIGNHSASIGSCDDGILITAIEATYYNLRCINSNDIGKKGLFIKATIRVTIGG
jgi:hypothetical protein